MTGGQRHELVEARADFILAGAPTAEAFAEHFEAQMHRGKVRKLLAPLRVFCRKGTIWLAVMLAPSALLGYAAFTSDPAPVMLSGANGVEAVNTASGRLAAVTPLRAPPGAIAAAGQAIWVAGYDTATVEKIAPASGRVLAKVRVGAGPAALAVGAGSLGVANTLGATVSRIDLATSAVTAIIPVGRGPAALAAGPGSVWVADQDSGTISRIDPRTDQVTANVGVTGAPTSLTITRSRMWAGIRGQP